jgi:hypothetical protein
MAWTTRRGARPGTIALMYSAFTRRYSLFVAAAIVMTLSLSGCTDDRNPAAPDSSSRDGSSVPPSGGPATTWPANLVTNTCPPEGTSPRNTRVAHPVDVALSFEVPCEWQPPVTGYPFPDYWYGATGVAQVLGAYGIGYRGTDVSDKLVAACDAAAHHLLRQFGSSPTVEMGQVDGHRACFIHPSADAPQAPVGGGFYFVFAAVYVEYRVPVEIGDPADAVGGVAVYADVDHFDQVIASVHFVDGH